MKKVVVETVLTGSIAALAIGIFNHIYTNSEIWEFPTWINCVIVGSIAAGSAKAAQALIPQVEKYTALEGFGATEQVSLAEIHKNIEIYKKHIQDLNKVLNKGSAAGREAASQKLTKVEQDLKHWEAKKELALKSL